MKNYICAAVFVLFCAGLMVGCAHKTDVDRSTIFIEKKGKITSIDVENLDKEYYDASELEEYIAKHVEEYTSSNGDTVKKASFDVEEGVAKLRMEYDSYEDYAKFNGVELYSGTLLKAQAEGYDFEAEFYAVPDDFEKASGAQSAVGKDEVLADEDNKVVILKANMDVSVPGDILFVSAKDTKVTDKRTVSVTGEGANEEAELTYIIYK